MSGLIKLIQKIVKYINGSGKEKPINKVNPGKSSYAKNAEGDQVSVIKYKSTQAGKDLVILKDKNEDLYNLVQDVAKYTSNKFNKFITITMIFRSQEEQDSIYQGKINSVGRKYDENPWKSPHQFWHSVDLRSRDFTKNEIKDLVDYINNKYNSDNFYKWTAKNHDVGLGDHFHIQYART